MKAAAMLSDQKSYSPEKIRIFRKTQADIYGWRGVALRLDAGRAREVDTSGCYGLSGVAEAPAADPRECKLEYQIRELARTQLEKPSRRRKSAATWKLQKRIISSQPVLSSIFKTKSDDRGIWKAFDHRCA